LPWKPSLSTRRRRPRRQYGHDKAIARDQELRRPFEGLFDGIRTGVAADRSQFSRDLSKPFYGANRRGVKVSQGVRDAFWFQGMQGGLKNELDCIRAFSETDLTKDLQEFDVPTLILHGDDDQIVPIGASARVSVKLIRNATLKIYKGAPHGLADTHKDRLNADLLAFPET
jgi:non-heme chloroperoxidase